MTTNYDHLDDDARALMDAPDVQRANAMLLDRFFTHERLEPILDHIEFLRHSPPHSRASGLIVSGVPGSGKTMLAEHVLRRYPPQESENGRPPTMPVLSISMTGGREAKILYNRMLERLGVPDVARYVGSDRERMVLKTCRAAGVRMLILDELQDLLTSTARQQRIALDTIKFLMNELSLPILALGTDEAPHAMKVDQHLNARFDQRVLPVWKQDAYLENLLDAVERKLPLARPSHLIGLQLSALLLKLSGGTLHKMMKLITYAAAHAVESGTEQITPQLLQLASRKPPVAAVRKAAEKAKSEEGGEEMAEEEAECTA